MNAENIVIIPTYNEAENIRDIIRAVMELPEKFDVLVVDDNSPDGTASLVKEMQKEFPERVRLLEREKKEGLGKAYIAGFREALKYPYRHIFEMDADFSHNPQDLPRLLKTLKEDNCDVAIGSRYISGVNVVNWPCPWDVSFCLISHPCMSAGLRECISKTQRPDL